MTRISGFHGWERDWVRAATTATTWASVRALWRGEGDRALGDGLGDGQGAARFTGEVAEALPDVITDDTDFGISRMGEGLGQGGDDGDGACHVSTGWVSLSSSSSG